MTDPTSNSRPAVTDPPTKHQLALMIWLAVFPTLTALNLVLGDWLSTLTPVLRTFVLATIAVPIVPLGPAGRKVAHLIAARACVPGFGDQLDPREHRVLAYRMEETRVAVESAVAAAFCMTVAARA